MEADDVTASLAAILPKGEANGLTPYARDMADLPRKIRAAVILFDCPKSTIKHDDDTTQVQARIRRIEVIRDSGDAAIMQRLLMRAFEERTGQTTLPFDLEIDVKSAFDGITLTSEEVEDESAASADDAE